MTLTQRILLVLAIIVIDACVFFLPLTALLVAVVLLARPVWFKDFVALLYRS